MSNPLIHHGGGVYTLFNQNQFKAALYQTTDAKTPDSKSYVKSRLTSYPKKYPATVSIEDHSFGGGYIHVHTLQGLTVTTSQSAPTKTQDRGQQE